MTQKEQAYEQICRRADLFHRHINEYKSEAKQNETETRVKFIDHFFKSLGWDMDNSKCLPPHLEEVIREETIGLEGTDTKPDELFARPTQGRTDYTFRDSKGKPLFYLEAKKPSVDILDGHAEALQIRSYSWNTNLPIGILTDFEEFAVYDGTIPTKPTDKAAIARAEYINYKQYSDKTTFDFLYDTFAQPNVTRTSLSRYQQTYNDRFNYRKGSVTVDDKFLQSLEEWRTELAQHIVQYNDQEVFSLDEINYFVQITLNRILFLRNCEDRNIEPYKALFICTEDVKEKDKAYANFLQLCERADRRYNSGLFDLTRYNRIAYRMRIGNGTLATLIRNTYYPVSPYRFELISPDILGTAYERFLGKTISVSTKTDAKGRTIETILPDGRRVAKQIAIVELKPEVRKAGGVFYTPQYVVQYIVENTIGKQIQGLTPNEVSALTFCDPACGSGSFLIGVYQYLIDWHTEYYMNNPKAAKAQPNRPAPMQGGRLTVAERKHILTNNIYGVDIDAQAVEVTKLSLLMLCLADSESPAQSSEHILPNIDVNIQCGNSLIDTEFDWKKQFKAVFEKGGFDAVVGNPPYVRQELWSNDYKAYFAKNYKTYHGLADLYVFFIEKSLDLLKKEGIYSIIVGNKWMRAGYGEPLRKFLLEKRILEITDFGDLPVFKGVAAYPCILTVQNSAPILSNTVNMHKAVHLPEKVNALYQAFETARTSGYLPEAVQESLQIAEYEANDMVQFSKKIQELYAYKTQLNGLFNKLQDILNEINRERLQVIDSIGLRMTLIKTLDFENLSLYVHENAIPWQQEKLGLNNWVITNDVKSNLLEKLQQKGVELKKYINGESYRGVITGLSEAFIIAEKDKKTIESKAKYPDILRPYCAGRDVQQYIQPKTDKSLILFPKGFTNKTGNNPAIPLDWLEKNYTGIAKHLLPFQDAAQKRYDKGDYWWELRACDYYPLFNQAKIMYQVFQVKPCFTLDTQGYFCNNSVWFIPTDEKYLLGLLNSKLGWYLITQYCSQIQGGYQLIWKYLSKIPIYKIDFNNATEKTIHDKISILVEKILLQKATSKPDTSALEAEIDALVYGLYGLTAAEVAVVEGV
jgi:type I restriction-modification system DNA methylase subunit